MKEIPAGRRIALALCAVGISAYILRPQLSDALVLRGDERLYRGSSAQALEYYCRALEIDPLDGAAADRLLFGAVTLRDRRLVRDAVKRSAPYLLRRPDDDVVRMDRAMALRLLGDWNGALADFTLVGTRKRDARALTFAGYAALKLGHRARALALWRQALAIDRGFVAAVHALRAHGAPR